MIVPLLGGLLTIIALVVYQYRAKNPLLTIREMLTSTIPIAGIIVALFAAAASVSATVLTASVLAEEYSPLHVGLLYLPEAAGAVITAVVLGLVLDKLFIHYLPLIGMGFLAAGIAVFLIEVPPSQPQTLVATFLTGIGLGATVAPALFVAGFSLRALNLQRVFAIVELFRAVAAFMIAPIFVYFAATVSDDLATGVRDRALDRARARPRRGRAGRRDLRTGRRAGADARHRRLHRGQEGRLVLAAAARAGQADGAARRRPSPKGRTDVAPDAPPARRRAAPPGPSSSPTTARSSPHSPSSARASSWRRGGRRWSSSSGIRPTSASRPSTAGTCARRPPTRSRRRPSRPRRTGPRSPRRPASASRGLAVEATPTWQGIVDAADEHGASLIVFGSHRRSGLMGHLAGSVTAATAAHSAAAVLVVHPPA